MCVSEEFGTRFFGCMLNLWLLPLVCGVGLILNIGCLIVFFSTRGHPLVPALIFLSFCDCLQLFFSFLVLFLPALHDFSQSTPYSTLGQLAYLSTGLLSPLLLAFNCASIWTICFISIQRHRAILRPLSSISSPSKPFKPLLFISAMALIFNGCKWAEFRWFWSHDPTNSSDYQYILAHEPSDLARNENYHRVLDNLLYPLLVYLVPLLLLSVLNFRILTNISNRRVSFDHKSRFAQERRSVTLLISIVTMFFLCHTGGLAYRFVDQEKYNNSELFVLLKDIINLLFNVYSFTNPLLYFVFTRQFRDLRTMWNSHFASPASRTESYAITLDNLLYPLLVYLVPLLLLSVLNFRILTNISNRRVSFDHKSRFAQERRSVTLLISIVTMFFLCHTGGLAYRFVDQEKYNNSELFVLLKDIINLLFNVYSFTNPLLYFVFTRQFRDLRTMWNSHFASPASRTESYAITSSKSGSSKTRHLSMPSLYRTPCVSGKLLP